MRNVRFLFPLLLLALCWSCEQELTQPAFSDESPPQSTDALLTYDVKGDHLVFADEQYFFSVLAMDTEELKAELQRFGIDQTPFTAHASHFTAGLRELEALEDPAEFSAFAAKWKDYMFFPDDSPELVHSTIYPVVAKLVNKEGILRVGPTYEKYTQRKIFATDQLSLAEVLDLNEESITQGLHPSVKVFDYNIKALSVAKDDFAECENTTAGATGGSYRIRAYTTLFSPPIIGQPSNNPILLNVEVHHQRYSSFWGSWSYRRGDLGTEVSGKVTFPDLPAIFDFEFSDFAYAHNRSYKLFQYTVGNLDNVPDRFLEPEFGEYCGKAWSEKVECTATHEPEACDVCPNGSGYDGANCRFTHFPRGSRGFYLQNGQNGGYTFYYTPLPGNNPCPHQPYPESGFDGANCLVKWGVQGEPFIYNQAFYVKPKCPCD